MEILLKVGEFLAKAVPIVIQLFEAHGSDEKKALDALRITLMAARAKNDIDLDEKWKPKP